MRTASILLAIVVVLGLGYALTTNKSEAPTDGTNSPEASSGQLQTTDTQMGTGEEATASSTITVHYLGKLADGTKFDASADHNGALRFTLGQGYVIKGWEQGVVGMKVGGKRTLVIPPSLAYGPQGSGPIPPNATLTFEIELLKVEKDLPQPVMPDFVQFSR